MKCGDHTSQVTDKYFLTLQFEIVLIRMRGNKIKYEYYQTVNGCVLLPDMTGVLKWNELKIN